MQFITVNRAVDARPLPRGPHRLTRQEVAASQRARLMTACTALLAERGYAGVTIGELAQRAQVSRATFYEHFDDKETCLLAAYDAFALSLTAAMVTSVAADSTWSAFIAATLVGYLGTLEDDPAAARAFIVEMDAAGPTARRRRRDAAHAIAMFLGERHRTIRATNPPLGFLSDQVWLTLVLGIRELVREALEEEAEPVLTDLAPEILSLIFAAVEGAPR